jgi:hypothetical protein
LGPSNSFSKPAAIPNGSPVGIVCPQFFVDLAPHLSVIASKTM